MRTKQVSFRLDRTLTNFVDEAAKITGVAPSFVFRAACEAGISETVRLLGHEDDVKDAILDDLANKLDHFFDARKALEVLRSEADEIEQIRSDLEKEQE